ncbi:GH92 family glycosyl hydrolase [Alloacidobacterium dinghuense]|uniref:GH92 family glycosyl hydrolase n=1 Tax=Alloacidobacterium dinghuense TaxID=2763107 RepID=UPI001C984EE6|nr:GH92 family glycosyl hydrolase [Alloacidobacterium dinghuense]
MKHRYAFILAALLFYLQTEGQHTKEPVDYVSPNIGGIGQLLTATIPYVQYPHGMARLAPITTPGITDRYLADKIYGFPAGPAILMASVGGDSSVHTQDCASDFDHDFEVSTPYYYAADLQTWNIKAELTATMQAAYYRFTFPASAHAHLVLNMKDHAEFTVVGSNAVEGSEKVIGPVGELSGNAGETREYFYAEFSKPFPSYSTWQGNDVGHEEKRSGDSLGFVTDQRTNDGEQIEVRVGISYISTEQARRNLERDIPQWNFNQIKTNAQVVWNKALGAMEVQGGSDRQRTIFYTALYRSLGRMTDITEDGKYFSGYDHAVHNAEGHDFYIDDGIWDTYRSLHPLQLLLDARQQEDMIRSYLRMYQQSGWLPSFPSVAGDQEVMIGHHAASLIADAYSKGYRDFDLNLAYAAMRKNATEATMLPWRRGPLTSLDKVYFEKGFFPALAKGEAETVSEVTGERRQAVSVTLENAYDDWCVAQIAKALGKQPDAEYFTKLAHNYQIVFNRDIGFMAPKSADGEWVADFDPKLGGGQGGRDYFTEVDSWIYTYSVQHDVAGLIQLMGGRDSFNKKLDQLFVEQYGTSKFHFLDQFPDATGLVGLYAQGNEPSFHIPYLYDFSGQPWKTQRRVRQLMDVWYGDGPLGIPGDDDGGATSSWYVLSAVGFYPVCPGSPVYEIGSPLFARSTIRLGNGKTFQIIANHVSDRNKYIQSATLNGKPLNKPWFEHADIANGGTLILEMADQPNLQWGSSPAAAPPSMSNQAE